MRSCYNYIITIIITNIIITTISVYKAGRLILPFKLIGAAFNNQLSIIVSSYQHRGYCHGNIIIVINTTISINILEYIFRRWVGREKRKKKPEKEGRGIRWVRVGVGKVAEMIAVQICG